MAAEGELMPEYAIDYFIFTAGAIDWSNFPEYLVGNVAYDQALIGHARRAGKKTRLFALPFYTKNDHFAKTGSGQT